MDSLIRVNTYFLPKLTGKELKLVESRDTSFLQTFPFSNPDVDETEMMLSESNSKYVYSMSGRKTFVIESLSEAPSETSLENNIIMSENNIENNIEEYLPEE